MNKVFCRAEELSTEPCSAPDACAVITAFLGRVRADTTEPTVSTAQKVTDCICRSLEYALTLQVTLPRRSLLSLNLISLSPWVPHHQHQQVCSSTS